MPQRFPVSPEYECVFFSPSFDYAAEYAVGEQSSGKSEFGFIQKYRFPKQTILDIGDREAFDFVEELTGERPRKSNDEGMLSLFWDPGPEWIELVESGGYTGTSMGDNFCIFDVSEAKLVAQWKVWPGGRARGGYLRVRRERVE